MWNSLESFFRQKKSKVSSCALHAPACVARVVIDETQLRLHISLVSTIETRRTDTANLISSMSDRQRRSRSFNPTATRVIDLSINATVFTFTD